VVTTAIQLDYDPIAVLVPFDCNSTALRPFDDIRHDRMHCDLNK